MNRRTFLKYAGISAVAGLLIPLIEYAEIPGTGVRGVEVARSKDGIAAVVAGIVAQKMYDNSQIDLQIEKKFWPDAKLTGNTTKNSIDAYVGLATVTSHFSAKKDSKGMFKGIVSKSEFNSVINQESPNSYHIERFGP